MSFNHLLRTVAFIAIACCHSFDAAAAPESKRPMDIAALLRRARQLEDQKEPLVSLDDAAALTWLSVERERVNRTADALRLLSRAAEFVDKLVIEGSSQSSSYDIEGVMLWAHQQDELAYSLCARHPKDSAVVAFGARMAHLRKAREIQRTTEFQFNLRLLPTTDATRAAIERAQEDLSTLLVYSYGRHDPNLKIAIGKVRGDLVNQLRTFATNHPTLRFNMPEGEIAPFPQGALVDFVSYRSYQFSSKDAPAWGEMRYGVFVTAYSITAQPARFVELGARDEIDERIVAFVEALRSPKSDSKPPAKALYDSLIAPLTGYFTEPFAASFSNIVVVPDGEVNLVPLDALWDGNNWLADRYSFTYAVSSRYRDLLAGSFNPDHPPRKDVLIFANPSFPSDGNLTKAIGGVTPLPKTELEAAAIARILGGAEVRTGERATVAAVRAAHPGILHIATHGFTLDGGGAAVPDSLAVYLQSDGVAEDVSLGPRAGFLRTLLVLSGAEALRQKGERLMRGERNVGDDGLLSAEEILDMDLTGTQLVTLAACESARGEMLPGAGLYGLQRALFIAGAETVIAGLWRVNGPVTTNLMIRFYARLVRGRPRGEALRGAMRTLRRVFPHPYYWAPFTLLGAALSPVYGVGDRAGPLPTHDSGEIPDSIPIGTHEPPPYTLHAPRTWSSLNAGSIWEPLWESESGYRTREVLESRLGNVSIWSVQNGTTLRNVAQEYVRGSSQNRNIDLGQYTFDPNAGAQADVMMPAEGRFLVRTYEFPTATSAGWTQTVELARDSENHVQVTRRYRGSFIDPKSPEWTRQ